MNVANGKRSGVSSRLGASSASRGAKNGAGTTKTKKGRSATVDPTTKPLTAYFVSRSTLDSVRNPEPQPSSTEPESNLIDQSEPLQPAPKAGLNISDQVIYVSSEALSSEGLSYEAPTKTLSATLTYTREVFGKDQEGDEAQSESVSEIESESGSDPVAESKVGVDLRALSQTPQVHRHRLNDGVSAVHDPLPSVVVPSVVLPSVVEYEAEKGVEETHLVTGHEPGSVHKPPASLRPSPTAVVNSGDAFIPATNGPYYQRAFEKDLGLIFQRYRHLWLAGEAAFYDMYTQQLSTPGRRLMSRLMSRQGGQVFVVPDLARRYHVDHRPYPYVRPDSESEAEKEVAEWKATVIEAVDDLILYGFLQIVDDRKQLIGSLSGPRNVKLTRTLNVLTVPEVKELFKTLPFARDMVRDAAAADAIRGASRAASRQAPPEDSGAVTESKIKVKGERKKEGMKEGKKESKKKPEKDGKKEGKKEPKKQHYISVLVKLLTSDRLNHFTHQSIADFTWLKFMDVISKRHIADGVGGEAPALGPALGPAPGPALVMLNVEAWTFFRRLHLLSNLFTGGAEARGANASVAPRDLVDGSESLDVVLAQAMTPSVLSILQDSDFYKPSCDPDHEMNLTPIFASRNQFLKFERALSLARAVNVIIDRVSRHVPVARSDLFAVTAALLEALLPKSAASPMPPSSVKRDTSVKRETSVKHVYEFTQLTPPVFEGDDSVTYPVSLDEIRQTLASLQNTSRSSLRLSGSKNLEGSVAEVVEEDIATTDCEPGALFAGDDLIYGDSDMVYDSDKNPHGDDTSGKEIGGDEIAETAVEVDTIPSWQPNVDSSVSFESTGPSDGDEPIGNSTIGGQMKHHMNRFQPAYIHCITLFELSAVLEKLALHRLALPCLACVLHSRASRANRGKTYIRLIVLSSHHFKDDAQALRWCLRALRGDEALGPGVQLEIAQKFRRLYARIAGINASQSWTIFLSNDPFTPSSPPSRSATQVRPTQSSVDPIDIDSESGGETLPQELNLLFSRTLNNEVSKDGVSRGSKPSGLVKPPSTKGRDTLASKCFKPTFSDAPSLARKRKQRRVVLTQDSSTHNSPELVPASAAGDLVRDHCCRNDRERGDAGENVEEGSNDAQGGDRGPAGEVTKTRKAIIQETETSLQNSKWDELFGFYAIDFARSKQHMRGGEFEGAGDACAQTRDTYTSHIGQCEMLAIKFGAFGKNRSKVKAGGKRNQVSDRASQNDLEARLHVIREIPDSTYESVRFLLSVQAEATGKIPRIVIEFDSLEEVNASSEQTKAEPKASFEDTRAASAELETRSAYERGTDAKGGIGSEMERQTDLLKEELFHQGRLTRFLPPREEAKPNPGTQRTSRGQIPRVKRKEGGREQDFEDDQFSILDRLDEGPEDSEPELLRRKGSRVVDRSIFQVAPGVKVNVETFSLYRYCPGMLDSGASKDASDQARKWVGCHCEGSILRDACSLLLFPLLFKRRVCAANASVFYADTQTAPADMCDPSCLPSRLTETQFFFSLLQRLSKTELFVLLSVVSAYLFEVRVLSNRWGLDAAHEHAFQPASRFEALFQTLNLGSVAHKSESTIDEGRQNAWRERREAMELSSRRDPNTARRRDLASGTAKTALVLRKTPTSKWAPQAKVGENRPTSAAIAATPWPRSRPFRQWISVPIPGSVQPSSEASHGPDALTPFAKVPFSVIANSRSCARQEGHATEMLLYNPVLGYTPRQKLSPHDFERYKQSKNESILIAAHYTKWLTGLAYGMELAFITAGFGMKPLLQMLYHLLRTWNYWSAGLPDLLLWKELPSSNDLLIQYHSLQRGKVSMEGAAGVCGDTDPPLGRRTLSRPLAALLFVFFGLRHEVLDPSYSSLMDSILHERQLRSRTAANETTFYAAMVSFEAAFDIKFEEMTADTKWRCSSQEISEMKKSSMKANLQVLPASSIFMNEVADHIKVALMVCACVDISYAHTKLSEVKGPGDSLSEKQRLWLYCLQACGADVELALVEKRSDGIQTKYRATKARGKPKARAKASRKAS